MHRCLRLAELRDERRLAVAPARMVEHELVGRAVRLASVSLRDIREPVGGAETQKLHDRLDALEQENRTLKERLERLEATHPAPAPVGLVQAGADEAPSRKRRKTKNGRK